MSRGCSQLITFRGDKKAKIIVKLSKLIVSRGGYATNLLSKGGAEICPSTGGERLLNEIVHYHSQIHFSTGVISSVDCGS